MKRCPKNYLSLPTMNKYVNAREKITYPEYLAFFLENVLTELEKDKISLSLLDKLIVTLTSFIEWNVERGFEVTKETLDKISSIRKLYEEYTQRTNSSNEDVNISIDLMEDKIKELFPDYEYIVEAEDEVKDDDKNETVVALQEEIYELKRELDKYKERIDALEKDVSERDRALAKREKKNAKVVAELDKKNAEIRELTKTLKTAYSKIDELKRLCEEKEQAIMVLSDQNADLIAKEKELNVTLFSLNKELKNFRRLLAEKERIILECKHIEEEIQKKVELRDKEIEGILIRRMLLGYRSNEELIKYMHEIGYNLSDDECISHINRIKISGILDELMVDENEFVMPLGIVNEGIYKISLDNTLCYEMVVVSDFHLESISKAVIEDMDLLYNYCTANGIPLIVNAGDFFSFKHRNKANGEVSISTLKRLIERIIDKYPKDKNIKQAVIGGNHDKEAISYGLDPIALLTENRDDFVNLGYGHSIISLGDGEINGIGIHHPNRRYQDFVGSTGYNSNEVKKSLNSYYISSSIVDRDSVYVDILGHIHRSSLDIENGICIAPSYMKDRVCNGAWHLKIFFDDTGSIKEIVFIPLIKNKDLFPTTEICYQKKLIK